MVVLFFVLDEDPDTGAKKYRYIRTGEDHFSLAFTYGLMALGHLSLPMSPSRRAWFERITAW